jgi:thioredoxin reductase
MPRTDSPRIAILGAGPIGLEAAVTAASLGLTFTVYEAGRIGEHVLRWGHVRMFTPFGLMSTIRGRARIGADNPGYSLPADTDLLTGRDYAAVYLDPLAASPSIAPHLKLATAVVQIARIGLHRDELVGDPRRARQPFRLLLRAEDGREWNEEADLVIDCTGSYGRPIPLGAGGILAAGETHAAPAITYQLEDILGDRRADYADRSVLVVGSGFSAATAVCALADLASEHPATWVVWLARAAGTQPIKRILDDPFRERDRLAARANALATRGDGNVEFHPCCTIDAVEYTGPETGFVVTGLRDGKPATWECERLIAHCGFSGEDDLARALNAPDSEPNYFVIGSKSNGRDSRFLLQTGFEQVRRLFAKI